MAELSAQVLGRCALGRVLGWGPASSHTLPVPGRGGQKVRSGLCLVAVRQGKDSATS